MITSQQSTLSLPELLFDNFTELFTNEEGTPLRVFNTLTTDYSKEDIRTIVTDVDLRSISCQTNERVVELLVFRALAMRETKKVPTVLVVPSVTKAKEVLSFLDRQLPCARIANLFSQVKRKKNHTIYGNPDFIVCSYQKLLQLLSKKSLVKVSAIVFLAPLSRTKYYSENILLDQILLLLTSKTNYTFIHGEELRLRKKDLESLFGGSAIVYHTEELFWYDLVEEFRMNIFENKALVAATLKKSSCSSSVGASYLLKLILSLTFRRRRNLKQLQEAIKQSISYKLWQACEQAITRTPGRTTYSVDYQLWLILHYLTVHCHLQLLEKKNDGYYYMTTVGQQFFHRFCFSDGLTVSLFYILQALSNKLEKCLLSQKDMEELLNDFTDIAIIWDVFYIDDNHAANHEIQKALNNSYSFRAALDIFEGLDEDFGFLAEEAKRSLEAQKTIMKEHKVLSSSALPRSINEQIEEVEAVDEVVEELEDYRTTKIYTKEFLEDYIQKIVSRENCTAQQLAIRTGVSMKPVKGVLERLVRTGDCLKITTKGVFHEEAIYGTEENFSAEPHLVEVCGTCVSYDSKTRLCIPNHLLAEFAYSSLTQEQVERAFNTIPRNTRACDMYQEANESKDFTIDYLDFSSYTRELMKALSIEENNSQKQYKHVCLFCEQQIKSFGTKENPFFPSKTIICSNCNSRYILLDERQKVRCLSDNKNVIRSIIISKIAYEPEILQQKEERIPLTVRDEDILELCIDENLEELSIDNKLKSYFLVFNGREYLLTELERIYFLGQKHLEIEEELKRIGVTRIYRKKPKKQASEEEHNEPIPNVDAKTSLDETTRQSYQRTIEELRKNGLMINPSLISKVNSVICFILAFSNNLTQGKGKRSHNFDKELGKSIKILMRAKGKVTNPEAARLLEAQAFKQAFKILKKVGRKAGIRSWGRVVSRLVSWLVFAVFTRTCAYSPLDSMLNHLFKVVLDDLKIIHKKVGIDVDLGAGFLHYRKSKSDIDRIGLFLDLVDFVRLIVIFVLAEAISNGEITSKDCRLFLGRGAIPLYDIKLSSLKKFEVLAERILNFKISYKNQEKPLKNAYEDYLQAFRIFLDNLSNRFDTDDWEQLSKNDLKEIIDIELKKADYQPLYFQTKDFEKILKVIDLCSNEWKFLYENFEHKFIARKKAREVFRRKSMNNPFGQEETIVDLTYNSTQEKYHVSLTKYQKRERRWAFYILLTLVMKINENQRFVGYTINDIKNFLGLKYERTRLLLKELLEKELLERKIGLNKSYFYFLNVKDKTIELLFNLLNYKLKNKGDFSIVKKQDVYNSKLLTSIIKQYIMEFLEESPILGIERKSTALENMLRGVLVQLNNWMER